MLSLQARGLDGIPGFSYRDDAGASFNALLAYASTTLGVFYGAGGAAIANDKQLQVGLGLGLAALCCGGQAWDGVVPLLEP